MSRPGFIATPEKPFSMKNSSCLIISSEVMQRFQIQIAHGFNSFGIVADWVAGFGAEWRWAVLFECFAVLFKGSLS
jgi:hypothetical protein